ncbi:TPA: hypothetical protein ACKTGI_003475 [Pseudomonas aeruginosa]
MKSYSELCKSYFLFVLLYSFVLLFFPLAVREALPLIPRVFLFVGIFLTGLYVIINSHISLLDKCLDAGEEDGVKMFMDMSVYYSAKRKNFMSSAFSNLGLFLVFFICIYDNGIELIDSNKFAFLVLFFVGGLVVQIIYNRHSEKFTEEELKYIEEEETKK